MQTRAHLAHVAFAALVAALVAVVVGLRGGPKPQACGRRKCTFAALAVGGVCAVFEEKQEPATAVPVVAVVVSAAAVAVVAVAAAVVVAVVMVWPVLVLWVRAMWFLTTTLMCVKMGLLPCHVCERVNGCERRCEQMWR